MSLTIGGGPLGRSDTASANFELPPGHALYFHQIPQRIRGELAGETVVDSRRARLLHETGLLPVWYFPREDVRFDLLQSTDHSTHCPFKGDATYWSVIVGDRVSENAVWGYPDPIDAAPDGIEDHVAFYFDKLDRWFEEDEERLGHPRDPFHRIDVLPTSARIRVLLDDTVLADTERARILFETGLPPRYYIHPDDVHDEHLEPLAELRTRCAYKGLADEWWSARAPDERVIAAAWRYRDPIPELSTIQGYIAFFNESVDIEVDGERQSRPESPFGSNDWAQRALEAAPGVR